MERMNQNQSPHMSHPVWTLSGGGTGGEVCRLRLHLVHKVVHVYGVVLSFDHYNVMPSPFMLLF